MFVDRVMRKIGIRFSPDFPRVMTIGYQARIRPAMKIVSLSDSYGIPIRTLNAILIQPNGHLCKRQVLACHSNTGEWRYCPDQQSVIIAALIIFDS
jgi:hypothetical protein